jgi:hypothetical protein
MKKNEVPQDGDNLVKGESNWLNYAVDQNGEYVQEISVGWEPENIALEQAWEVVNEKVEEARTKVLSGQLSPIAFYMEVNIMDIPLLANYMDKYQWQVRRHLQPDIFKQLSKETLDKYAYVFKISRTELMNVPTNKNTK